MMEESTITLSNSETELEKIPDPTFYKNAALYWSNIPPTVDGMLGGFGFVSSIDISSSSAFLKRLFKSRNAPGKGQALDCGAGIGRITKHLLLEKFEKVDLVEQNPAFVEQASSFIGDNKHLGNIYCSGLQDFTPEPYAYDVIWCQWVLGHLMDEDLTHFLQKCKHGLRHNGVIVVKENVTRDGQTEFDATDSSVTRSLTDLKAVLESAGLKCLRVQRQERFPRVLYPVYMFALRPLSATVSKKKKNLAAMKPAEGDVPGDHSKEIGNEDAELLLDNNNQIEITKISPGLHYPPEEEEPSVCSMLEYSRSSEEAVVPIPCNDRENDKGTENKALPGSNVENDTKL